MELSLWTVVSRTIVVHTVTYFAVGVLTMLLFRYSKRLAGSSVSPAIRSTDDPLVRAGVLFQPVRGALFGLVFYLLRDVVFRPPTGWLVLWAALVVIGIVSTFGPARGSIEGFIYLKPASDRMWGGVLEVLGQSLLLAAMTSAWVRHPDLGWLNWTLVVLFAISLLLPALGLLAGARSSAGK
jgi:hypothetical protein